MNRPILLMLLLALSGCASPTARYPSLLPRAIELRDDSEPVRTVPDAAPDAALDTKIAELQAALAESNATFAAARTRAEPLTEAARSAAIGSDAWLNAQAALSGLDGARGQTLATLSDIDRLSIDRAQAGLPPYPKLTMALEAGSAQAERQAASITALQRQLPDQ